MLMKILYFFSFFSSTNPLIFNISSTFRLFLSSRDTFDWAAIHRSLYEFPFYNIKNFDLLIFINTTNIKYKYTKAIRC